MLSKEIEKDSDRAQAGMGMIEVLAAIILVAIVSIAIATTSMGALRIAKKTEINYAASNLALSKIEELAAFSPLALDASFNAVESAVSTNGLGITFERTTVVTINADDSRSVAVTVKSNSTAVATKVSFATNFAVW